MNDEYISRDELRKHLADCMTAEFFDSDMKKAVVGIDVYVENMPAANVQPVKHGRWEEITDYERDKMLRDTVAELCEAKRLLKAAVEALNDGSCNKDCRQCENHKSCDYDNRFKWKHTNEVLKLIGEGGDEECQ